MLGKHTTQGLSNSEAKAITLAWLLIDLVGHVQTVSIYETCFQLRPSGAPSLVQVGTLQASELGGDCMLTNENKCCKAVDKITFLSGIFSSLSSCLSSALCWLWAASLSSPPRHLLHFFDDCGNMNLRTLLRRLNSLVAGMATLVDSSRGSLSFPASPALRPAPGTDPRTADGSDIAAVPQGR